MIKQDEKLLGQPIFENPEQSVFQNPEQNVPSNEMGNAKPVFNPSQAANAEYIFGAPEERAKSMPQRGETPLAKLGKTHCGCGSTKGPITQRAK